jgi:hypothetical protein
LSIPVPLGVRIFDHAGNVDIWVTRWVEQLQFRSVIPGGFASASFRLHVPQYMYPVSAAWSTRAPRIPLIRMFNRVQIVDLRTGEIAWEGRIDSPARVEDDGFAWDIGCAGAMVSATDITKPVFYADSSTDWWFTTETNAARSDVYSWSRTDNPPSLGLELKDGSQWDSGGGLTPGGTFGAYYHMLCLATDQYLGRFSVSYRSATPSSGTIKMRANVYTPSTNTWQDGVDSTNLGTADTTKSNAVGAASSFTSTVAQVIDFDILGPSTPVVLSAPCPVSFTNPIVIAMRFDRNGNYLTASSNYSTDYVTVSQVVEDVLGRFLYNSWTNAGKNVPADGSVTPVGAYIDTSDTTQITDLRFTDGATAADILNQLMTVQTGAYWAIWESQNTATNGEDAQRYRFEWATWPDGWGYQASTVDGFDEQPDGSNVYNFVFYRYQDIQFAGVSPGGSYVPPPQVQEWWDFTDVPTAPLLQGRVTRAATLVKDSPTTNASTLASNWIAANGKEVNTGAIIIKRPIMFFDAGADSGSGAGRMVDPWMLRPGKLIRITDIQPQADSWNINHGTAAPPATHAGTVFKVVATDYDADSNACRLELDQVTTWSLPGQILPAAASNAQTVVG